MFRFRKSVPLSRDRQGYIYYFSRLYKSLDESDRTFIKKLCKEAAGENWRAVLDVVTGKLSCRAACSKHYISESTLERGIRKYYIAYGKAWAEAESD